MPKEKSEKNPEIVGFACSFCTFKASEMAGSLRMKYPQGVKIVQVPCSSRVDPAFVIKALFEGADGVFVAGCHPGDCHFKEGNHHAARRAALLAAYLAQHGLEPERFSIDWVAAGEGERLQRVVTDFYTKVAALPRLKLARRRPPEARP